MSKLYRLASARILYHVVTVIYALAGFVLVFVAATLVFQILPY